MSSIVTAHEEVATKTSLGFWIYLMTDCILFASLFATYIVLRDAVHTGPSGSEIFDMPFVLGETMLLLVSSFTCGLAMLALHGKKRAQVINWIVVTILLGGAFLAMEITEFTHLVSEGNGPATSAFLSAFFTLVGTHGLHITVGLLWLIVLIVQIAKKGLSAHVARRLMLASMFWHFLDIIWIFIFTIVYLMGVA